MADNTTLNVQSGGDTIASDDVSGVKFQRFKKTFGADGINDGDARSPNIFKTATATASGDTALWTPTSGKKFRLLKVACQVTSDAAQTSGGDITIALRDSTTAIGISFSVYVPTLAGTIFGAGFDLGWLDLGELGYVSTVANNVLNINLSATLNSGVCRVIAAGTEES